ncbi:MAG: SiaB family protein kinase [Bacteroidales bacterium]|nr:SiaB family protein kinase [Bacteroidales bacterium]
MLEETENRKLNFALELFRIMQKDNLGYIYRGRFNQEITDSILSLTETNLDKEEESPKIKKRVYSIMVECLQNITRHQDDTKEESNDSFGVFVIQKEGEKYYITSGNLIDKENIPNITDLIEKINSLDKDELKDYYKEVLSTGELSSKGGAGLGLIDMARKSGNKLAYRFKDVSEKFAYFYLHTIPSLSVEGEDFADDESLTNIVHIHEILNNENILLIFNGVFNQGSLLSLLNTIEGQMAGPANTRRKMFYIVVEMLQNIVKHGYSNKNSIGNPGLFLISEKDDNYFLTTGNYIEKQNVATLKKKLEKVNSLSGKDLENYYNERLVDFDSDNNKKSGLGVIDLKMKSENELRFELTELDDKMSFFVLQAKVKIT